MPPATSAETEAALCGDGTYKEFLPLDGGDVTGNLTVQSKNVVRSVNGVNADANGNVPLAVEPIGMIYVQFGGQAAPADLFGGTWSNVSSSYAGLFFRAEGGSAAAFGSSQAGGLPEIFGGFTLGSTCKQGLATSGAFYTGGATHGDDNNSKGSSPDIYFRASRSNGLYGDASEVRPINSTIRIWKRTA